jgi:hypothetical protein
MPTDVGSQGCEANVESPTPSIELAIKLAKEEFYEAQRAQEYEFSIDQIEICIYI